MTKPRTARPPPRRGAIRTASLFRNGANQAVRLPQDLRFPDDVRVVEIRRVGKKLLLSAASPGWSEFFADPTPVGEDFLLDRDDPPPQRRSRL